VDQAGARQPEFQRVLDICCGPGRHAKYLVDEGYEVTGMDRDPDAIRQAREAIPAGRFLELDQRDLRCLTGPFDAAAILWQSFGYFEPADNDQVVDDIAGLLRPGGRLLLDLFHLGYFAGHQGRTTTVRDPRCLAITNTLEGSRLTSTIEYADGTEESMNWELFSPDSISTRVSQVGFREIERCQWWDRTRSPSPDAPRFQIIFERV
jgi:SAM-dependent methyltransferase